MRTLLCEHVLASRDGSWKNAHDDVDAPGPRPRPRMDDRVSPLDRGLLRPREVQCHPVARPDRGHLLLVTLDRADPRPPLAASPRPDHLDLVSDRQRAIDEGPGHDGSGPRDREDAI